MASADQTWKLCPPGSWNSAQEELRACLEMVLEPFYGDWPRPVAVAYLVDAVKKRGLFRRLSLAGEDVRPALVLVVHPEADGNDLATERLRTVRDRVCVLIPTGARMECFEVVAGTPMAARLAREFDGERLGKGNC